jgi:hypothetical protein
VTTFGESHCKGVGAIVDGCPPGLALTEADIQPQLTRRRPGQSRLATPRDEADRVTILSGTERGVALGTPIGLFVPNENVRPGDSYETVERNVREALTPPTPEEIAASIARLFSHYPSPQSGNTMTVAQDWIEDMGQVSAVAFRAAVVEWRKGANAFRPSPGQLLSLIERIESPVRDRLEFALEVEEREEGMSIRERIAHLHHRQYELEMGMVPYDVHAKGYDEIQHYLASETALVKAEIQQLEQGA